MRVTDKLIQDAKKREKKRNVQRDDEEETYTYFPRMRREALNQSQGAFGSVLEEGINTRKSVFDESAVFCMGDRKGGAGMTEGERDIV
ncbi:MAG: hypothetical protein K2P27_11480 [Lachnospiraceae bacterium]|nr:hypothetical protein [Lachnospiraceae bacterium]